MSQEMVRCYKCGEYFDSDSHMTEHKECLGKIGRSERASKELMYIDALVASIDSKDQTLGKLDGLIDMLETGVKFDSQLIAGSLKRIRNFTDTRLTDYTNGRF